MAVTLGLVSSETVDDYWSQNSRRKVFYNYPNGTAPLTGLISLTETESTPHPDFGWFEERWEQLSTTTAAGPTSNVAFYLGGTTTTAGATFTPTAGTAYRIYMTATDLWQVDDTVTIHGLPLSALTMEATFLITAVQKTTSPYYVETICQLTGPSAVTNNTSAIVGLRVIHAGSNFAEGSRSRTGRRQFPVEVVNYTEINKTAFEMTGTALKEPTKYDKTGAYKHLLKGNGINHLAGLEWKAFTGNRRKTTAVDDDTGETVRRGFTGGLLWFLKQWELGNVSNGGAFDYRPGGADITAQTDIETYPDKRIIRLGGTAISLDYFEAIESLPFQKVNSNEFCKLCLCGPGYLAKINQRFRKEVQVTQLKGDEFKGFNFELHQRHTLNGSVYYKMHPLFAGANSPYRNSAFYIDLGLTFWRPLDDRDTDIMQMIQLPDADKRKDQWLTEGGYEFRYPEAHMFVDRLGGVTI